ncbi:MAG: hypothetical protein ACXIUZ_05235 [Lysobacteraceae bacterium]
MSPYTVSLWIHIGAGAVALASFWTAAAVRKGGATHRLVGRTFLCAMVLVVASALPLVAGLWLRGQWIATVFLAFVLLLVSSGLLVAWRAVALRRDFGAFVGGPHRPMAATVLAGGLVVCGLGLWQGVIVFVAFGLVGVLAGAGALRRAGRGPGDARWWLREHYGAMIGNGVATHIAFLGVGLRRVLPGLDPALHFNLAWLTPVAVAVVAGIWLDRRYGRPAAAPVSPGAPGRGPVA